MGAGAWSIVIIPMLTCGMLERRSKLRRPLKPDGGLLKFLSTYPSNMKLKSVPHWWRGPGGGGVGAGAVAGACPAGGVSGVCAWAVARPPRTIDAATRVAKCVSRIVLLQVEMCK